MDGSGAEHETVEDVDEVRLRKHYEPEAFHQPAVVYEIGSERDGPAQVRLIETIPETLSPSDLGFTDSGTERGWEIKGPKLVFETTIDPDAAIETACVARRDAAGDIDALLGSPDAFEVRPAAEAASSFTRSAGAGAESAPAEQTATPATQTDAAEDRERVVDQFVAELRAGAVSPESIQYLREELGVTEQPPRSVEARLKQLQTDLSDVRAYTNALEAFIDEQGSAEEIIERFERRLDSVADSVEDLDGEVADNDAELDRLQADVGDLEAEVHALTRELEALGETLDDVDEDLDSLDERLDDLEDGLPDYDIDDRFAELDDELEEVSAFTENLRSVFSE
jgi:archaellum component FlaC